MLLLTKRWPPLRLLREERPLLSLSSQDGSFNSTGESVPNGPGQELIEPVEMSQAATRRRSVFLWCPSTVCSAGSSGDMSVTSTVLNSVR